MRINSKGIGGHQSAKAISVEYYTPPEIVHALGEFDLDPCYPIMPLPWQTAKKVYTKEDDGLLMPWDGRVWLNPPYGRELATWVNKMALHNNGILLCFNRSDTDALHKYVYPFATSHFILRRRPHFYRPAAPGQIERMKANSGGPIVLFAYGEQNSEALETSGLPGFHFPLNSVPVFIMNIGTIENEQQDSWRQVIAVAISKLNGRAEVKEIYSMVERIAKDKVQNNQYYKEKIRQKLQAYFVRVERGIYSNN